jgi:S1-C subfamily serine protease
MRLPTPSLALCLLLASAPALSATHRESSRLDWREDGHHLALDAEQSVVRVRNATPAGHFGVRAGDRVLRVGTQPVRSVDDLTTALGRSGPGSVPVTVQRDGREQTVQVATAAWRGVLPPPAPAPPPPPPPPRR